MPKLKKAKETLSFTGHEFKLIAVAGATLWEYCKDVNKTPSDFVIGLQGLSKLIDSPEKAEAICADKVLLIGCFCEVLDGQSAPTE